MPRKSSKAEGHQEMITLRFKGNHFYGGVLRRDGETIDLPREKALKEIQRVDYFDKANS